MYAFFDCQLLLNRDVKKIQMSYKIFLKYEGIEGNITTKGFETFMEVNSVQWHLVRNLLFVYFDHFEAES